MREKVVRRTHAASHGVLASWKPLLAETVFRFFLAKSQEPCASHLVLHVRQQLDMGAPIILNIESYSCEQDEDFVG